MIIAAYAGTGKTTFAEMNKDAIDISVMPYKWILPDLDDDVNENEKMKGALCHIFNPVYPNNYILDVIQAEKEYKYVIIPTDYMVIHTLCEAYNRSVLLIYPDDTLKKEYLHRYKYRGNSDDFISLFVDQWDNFLNPIKQMKNQYRIVLQSGQYLETRKSQIDLFIEQCEVQKIEENLIKDLEQNILEKEESLCISYLTCGKRAVTNISNIKNP